MGRVMENVNGGLSLSEGFMAAIGRKDQETDHYVRWGLRYFG